MKGNGTLWLCVSYVNIVSNIILSCHLQVCNAGYFKSGNSCVLCPGNKIKTTAGDAEHCDADVPCDGVTTIAKSDHTGCGKFLCVMKCNLIKFRKLCRSHNLKTWFLRKVMRERSSYVIKQIILNNNENAITKYLTCYDWVQGQRMERMCLFGKQLLHFISIQQYMCNNWVETNHLACF